MNQNNISRWIGLFFSLLLLVASPALAGEISPLEKEIINRGLLDVQTLDPSIRVELKYSTPDNFLGQDVYGDLNNCYLQPEAAQMLAKAQNLLKQDHPKLSLLVYDGVRPRRIQKKMWDTVKGTDKQKYVGNPKYGSVHNYGAAVDLTIVDENGAPLDMGTPFDYFGKLAQPRLEQDFFKKGKLTRKHLANRKLLRDVMTRAGFLPITVEWWHFNAFSKKTIRKKYQMIE